MIEYSKINCGSQPTRITNRNQLRKQEMMMSADKNVVLVLVVVVVLKS